jgi:hypothetical protein
LEKTSLKSVRNNIHYRMTTRLEDSIMERLEHRACAFWHTEEHDISWFDTTSTTEGEIDEDICVAFEDFCLRSVHNIRIK